MDDQAVDAIQRAFEEYAPLYNAIDLTAGDRAARHSYRRPRARDCRSEGDGAVRQADRAGQTAAAFEAALGLGAVTYPGVSGDSGHRTAEVASRSPI